MTLLTFTFKPEITPVNTTQYQTIKTQFGDGYKQRASAGLNAKMEMWELSFPMQSTVRAAAIKAFIDTVGGSTPFLWQAPDSATLGRYILVDKLVKKYRSADFSDITLTFEQDFGHST